MDSNTLARPELRYAIGTWSPSCRPLGVPDFLDSRAKADAGRSSSQGSVRYL